MSEENQGEGVNKYIIEKINADNHRPGMPKTGYLIRYNPHDSLGWLCCRTVATLAEAEAFAATLIDGFLPKA